MSEAINYTGPLEDIQKTSQFDSGDIILDFARKHRASIETLKTEEDRKGFLILAQEEDQKFFALAKKIVAASRKFYGDEKPVKTKKSDVTTAA